MRSLGWTGALAGALALTLAGCSGTSETFHLETVSLPYVPRTADGAGADIVGLSSDAKQRFTWARTAPGIEIADLGGPLGTPRYRVADRQILCAEPSPDVAAALASAVAASFSGSVPAGAGKDGSKEVEAGFQRAIAESVIRIGARSQTIQLMRDTLYRTCEAYANGALDEFSYSAIVAGYERFTMEALGLDALSGAVRVDRLDNPVAGAGVTVNAPSEGKSATADAANPSVAGGGNLTITVNAPAANQGVADAIRDIALNPSKAQGDLNAIRGACFFWFARNPQITLLDAFRPDAPAIARFCVDLLHRTPAEKTDAATVPPGFEPAYAQAQRMGYAPNGRSPETALGVQ